MKDVLDLYAEAPDPQRPVVCFDESPTQLIGEVREPIPAKPGQLERYDCEYRRNGTVNLFVFLDAHWPLPATVVSVIVCDRRSWKGHRPRRTIKIDILPGPPSPATYGKTCRQKRVPFPGGLEAA
jgi:hypothetical protein